MTITELGVKFKALPRFKLNGYTHIEQTSEEFINNFIKVYNEKYYTTENDKNVCAPKMARSIEDIYRITKTYYPQLTLRSIMIHLAKGVTNKKFNVLFCNAIKKRVFNIKFTQFNSFGEEGTNYYERYKGTEIGCDEHGLSGDNYLNLLK